MGELKSGPDAESAGSCGVHSESWACSALQLGDGGGAECVAALSRCRSSELFSAASRRRASDVPKRINVG